MVQSISLHCTIHLKVCACMDFQLILIASNWIPILNESFLLIRREDWGRMTSRSFGRTTPATCTSGSWDWLRSSTWPSPWRVKRSTWYHACCQRRSQRYLCRIALPWYLSLSSCYMKQPWLRDGSTFIYHQLSMKLHIWNTCAASVCLVLKFPHILRQFQLFCFMCMSNMYETHSDTDYLFFLMPFRTFEIGQFLKRHSFAIFIKV